MKKILLLGSVFLFSVLSSCEVENDPTSSTQCHAITQKGKRCKRMVADGEYYCWQHR